MFPHRIHTQGHQHLRLAQRATSTHLKSCQPHMFDVLDSKETSSLNASRCQMHARTWVRPKCELTNCRKSQLKIKDWSKWIRFEIMIGQDLLCEICINSSYFVSICIMSFCFYQFVNLKFVFFLVFRRFFPLRLRSSRLGGPRWLREGDESSGKRGERLHIDVGNSVFGRHGDMVSGLRTASRDGFAGSQDWIAHSVLCCHMLLRNSCVTVYDGFLYILNVNDSMTLIFLS